MQCLNCGFENVPGLDACVRCQSSLNLNGVDVLPPRKPKGLLGWIQGRRRPRGLLFQSVRRLVSRTFPFHPPQSSLLRVAILGLIPGLGQIRRGQKRVGRVFLFSWLLAMLLAIFLAGTPGGWFVYGLLLFIHCVSFSHLAIPVMQNFGVIARILAGLAFFIFLNYGLYGSARWLLSGMVTPIQITNVQEGANLQRGDVVLCWGRFFREQKFYRGDVVLYSFSQDYRNGAYVREGLCLDRIVGMPGERLMTLERQIWVNGALLEKRFCPLNSVSTWSDKFIIQADSNQYLIIPSTAQIRLEHDNEQIRKDFANNVFRVDKGSIVGKAFWRFRPLGRFGSLE